MTEYYVSGCIEIDGTCGQVNDEEAGFFTLYEKDGSGLSQCMADFTDRLSAEAAMRVYQERDALQQQVNALAAEVHNCRDFVAEHLGPEAELQFSGLSTEFAEAIKRQWMAEGVDEFGKYHNFAGPMFIQREAIKFAAQLRQPEEKGHE